MPDTPSYFAYGSNMSSTVMTARCPTARPLGPAMVEGWELCFRRPSRRWGGHAADIRPAPAAVTWGVLWALGRQEWTVLDRYEAAYRRVSVEVRGPDGPEPAVTYVVDEPEPGGAPVSAYLEAMRDGAAEHGLPPAWRRSLAEISLLDG